MTRGNNPGAAAPKAPDRSGKQPDRPEMPANDHPKPGINRPEMIEGNTRRSPSTPEMDERGKRRPGTNAPETPGNQAPQPGIDRPETGEPPTASRTGYPNPTVLEPETASNPQPGVLEPETAGSNPQPGVLEPETAGSNPQPGVVVPETADGAGTSPSTPGARAEALKATALPQRDASTSDVLNHEYPEVKVDDAVAG